MLKMATHEAADLIESMPVFDSLEDALAEFHYVVGTTARTGRRRRPTETPREAASRLVSVTQRNRCALVFGSEKWGLNNGALRLCQSIVTIPTASFASLNLAQSVMILCYEVFMAHDPGDLTTPALATSRELEGMYRHLAEAFLAIGFIRPDNPDYWMNNVRRLFARIQPQAREVKLVRGFCRQLLWALGNRKSLHG